MKRKSFCFRASLLIILIAGLQAEGQTGSEEEKKETAYEFPNAGLSLKLPANWELLPPDDITSLVRIGRKLPEQKNESYDVLLAVQAFPTKTTRSAKEFARSFSRQTHELEKTYKITKDYPLKEDNASEGQRSWFVEARYKRAGKTVRQIRFFRTGVKVNCVLTLDVTENAPVDFWSERAKPLMKKVVDSMVLSDPVSPSTLPVEIARTVTHTELNFTIGVPKGWQVLEPRGHGMVWQAGIVDFLIDRLLPSAMLTTGELREEAEPKEIQSSTIERMQNRYKERFELLSRIPAMMAGIRGGQFVAKVTDEDGTEMAIAQRTIVADGNAWVLTVTSLAEHKEQLERTISTLADSLQLSSKAIDEAK
jgi:hypothetical protein